MKECTGIVLTMVAVLGSVGGAHADEFTEQVARQKQAAMADWDKLELNKPTFHEDRLFLIYGELPQAQLRGLAADLDRHYQTARKALGYDTKVVPWSGKLAVFVFADRRHLASFIRLIEKRRPQEDDQGGFDIRSDPPHICAGPPAQKGDPGIQAAAGEQLAAALLARKAGASLPDWLLYGFGRATAWRATPPGSPAWSLYAGQRSKVVRLVKEHRRTAQDVWGGTLKADEAPLLQASLADYLAYGPGSARFVKFIEGFKPEEGKTEKTTADALKAADLAPDRLNQGWYAWLPRSAR